MSSFWGIVFYIRNIILLVSTTKKHYSFVDPATSLFCTSTLKAFALPLDFHFITGLLILYD